MAPPAPPPSRLFAELDLAPAPAPAPAPEGRVGPPALTGREVHVSGSAELSARPDRARVSLRLGSRKEAAVAARSSVSRRLEYITHSARLRGVPEENMTVTEDFSRVENTYQMEAEVCIIFSDFGKMQNICNLLIEKLGTSVTINPPHFYHTPEAIDTLRFHFCSKEEKRVSDQEQVLLQNNIKTANEYSFNHHLYQETICKFWKILFFITRLLSSYTQTIGIVKLHSDSAASTVI